MKQEQEDLIQLLSDGQFHSGESIATHFNISRGGIWRRINALEEGYNLSIDRVSGRGYRLSYPLHLFNREQLEKELFDLIPINAIYVHHTTDSTNQFLKDRIAGDVTPIALCVTEHQSKGRGRHHRVWHSPYGANLYFSLHRHFEQGFTLSSSLTLAIAIAVAEVLKEIGLSTHKIKWPNDIEVNDKKLAGILVECQSELNGGLSLVIGVGLNLQMPTHHMPDDIRPWTDLNQILFNVPDKTALTIKLVRKISATLDEFSDKGFEVFQQKWSDWDALINRPVTVFSTDNSFEGIAKGITHQGYLNVQTPDELKTCYSGDVSVTPLL